MRFRRSSRPSGPMLGPLGLDRREAGEETSTQLVACSRCRLFASSMIWREILAEG